MIRSEISDCDQLSNTTLNRDNKLRCKKNGCHPSTPERRLNISSRRSKSSQRSYGDNNSGNDRRRERSSSRK